MALAVRAERDDMPRGGAKFMDSNMRKAFTLIELLIVVAIIAILAAIAVPNFLEAQTRSKVAAAKGGLRTLQTALEVYAVDNNTYPFSESRGATIWMPPGGKPRFGSSPPIDAGGLTSPIAYLTSLPDDPFKHEVNGVPVIAPLYYERAGFSIWDTIVYTNWPVDVPADAVGTSSFVGTGADTQVGDDNRTPAKYDLYSLGPDLLNEVRVNGVLICNSRYNLNNRYDPTNGTVSPGNIVRFPSGTMYP